MIDVRVEGDGPPLLLIRPLGGSMALWGRFGEAMSRGFRTIAFDLPGVGRSREAPVTSSTRELARVAASVLDTVGVERAHVLGVSLGGMIATWLAIDAPDRVDRLILASTIPWGPTARHGSPMRALSVARCLALGARDRAACLVRGVLSREFARARPDEVARIEALARASPASLWAILAMTAAGARHDARRALERIRAETLILAGARDTIVDPASQRWMVQEIPRARFETIDSGHDPTLEAPEEAAHRVRAFLTAVPRA